MELKNTVTASDSKSDGSVSHHECFLSASRSLSASDPNFSGAVPSVRSEYSRISSASRIVCTAMTLRRMRPRSGVNVEDDDLQLVADSKRLPDVGIARHPALAQRNQTFDARLELDEWPELGDARHPARAQLAGLVGLGRSRPAIGGELRHPRRSQHPLAAQAVVRPGARSGL